jgi:hypothetical protein
MVKKGFVPNLLLFILAILLTLNVVACREITNVPHLQSSNMEVINYRNFYLDSAATGQNTYVRGSIFTKQNKQNKANYHLQIVSWIEIDPQDIGGVTFHIPAGWYVSSINTDFPQGNSKPEDYTSVWYNNYYNQTPETGKPIWIQVGGIEMTHRADAFGKGNVIIEIEPISLKDIPPDDFEIKITVGPRSPNSLNQQTIALSLPVDYRTLSP